MRNGAISLSFLVALLLCGAASAAKTPELKFLNTTELPDIGLKIKLMPNSIERPLPSPESLTYTFTQTRDGKEKTWKEEMMSPMELWRHSQHAGMWVDKINNTLLIATIKTPYPAAFKTDHISQEMYDKEMAKAIASAPQEWTIEQLVKWTEVFTESEGVNPEAVSRPPSKLKNMVKLRFEDMKTTLAYAFQLNTKAAGQSRAPQNWFLIIFDVNPDINTAKAEKAITSQFFPYLTVSRTLPSSTIKRTGLNMPKPTGIKRSTNKSPEFLASRNTVVNSIKNMQDWWFKETENYIFLSNLKSRYTVMVQSLQKEIEYLRSAYEQFIPPKVPINDISVIRVFASSAEYAAYVGKKYAWSGGLWVPSRKELIIRSIEWGGSKDNQKNVRRTMYHEAFHQYIHFALEQAGISVWYNEGHAELFANSRILSNKLTIEEDPYSIKEIEGLIFARQLNIENLLKMNLGEFYAKNDKKRKQNYSLAWALVYYLRKGAPTEKPLRYAHILDKYLEEFWKTKDPDKATDFAFEGIDMDKFEKDFTSFWESKNKRGYAKRNLLFKKR